jgi:tetratricopeptide (TPR) repeat protein
VQNSTGLDFRSRGDSNAAREAFCNALQLDPGYTEAHANLTDLLLERNRSRELASACRAALEFDPADAELHCKLAIALEKTHRLDAARRAAEQALAIDPAHARAQLTLAKIDRRSGNLGAARARLEKLQYARLTPPQQSAVLVELGDVYDRLGEYTLAFYTLNAGNQAMLRMVDPATINPNAIFKWIDKCRQTFTREFMDGWATAEPDDGLECPVFLVGFPRSGTTLTEQIISATGRVLPSDEEDILHHLIKTMPKIVGWQIRYPEDLDKLTEAELTRLRGHYWILAKQMLQTDLDGRILLDKLPLNLIELGFIHRLFPSARIVVVLRDPRDSCLSCFMRGFVPNEAMINFVNLEQTAKLYAAVMGYWMHLRSFIRQPWIEARYEDIVGDFENSTRRLLDFLDLEWSDSITNYHEQTRRHDVRTPSYSDISQPIYTRAVDRWENYAGPLSTTRATLKPFIEAFGYNKK